MPSEVVSYVDFLPTLKDQFDGFVGCPNVASQAISQNTARIKHRLAVLTRGLHVLRGYHRASLRQWVIGLLTQQLYPTYPTVLSSKLQKTPYQKKSTTG